MSSLAYTRFFWSDWRAATGHLDLMERGAYMALLEFVYQHQKPIPGELQRVYRLTHATSTTEQKAVADMLKEFFFQFEDPEFGLVWRHMRAEREIEWSLQHQGGATNKAKNAAEARWGKGINDEIGEPMTRAQRLKAARDKAKHTEDEWLAMVSICGSSCLSCGSSGDGDGGIVKDHIQPIYQGGSDGIDNLQPLCQRCNARKGPTGKDLRPKGWKRMLERLLKQSSDACLTPATQNQNQNHNQNKNQEPEPNPEPGRKKDNRLVDLAAPIDRDAPVNIVFRYWQETMGHKRAKLDAKRKRAITARLREGHTVDEIKQAIDGCKASPWHQGKNDRQAKFDDIELICRDAVKLDRFRVAADQAARQSNELDDWLNEDKIIEGNFNVVG